MVNAVSHQREREHTMTDAPDLATWLRAQCDEDERLARRAGSFHPVWSYDPETFTVSSEAYPIAGRKDVHGAPLNDVDGEHIANWDPARVLADIDSKRRIIDAVEHYLDPHPGQPCTNEDNPWVACDPHVRAQNRVHPYALQLLALSYADRPGYRDEWRP